MDLLQRTLLLWIWSVGEDWSSPRHLWGSPTLCDWEEVGEVGEGDGEAACPAREREREREVCFGNCLLIPYSPYCTVYVQRKGFVVVERERERQRLCCVLHIFPYSYVSDDLEVGDERHIWIRVPPLSLPRYRLTHGHRLNLLCKFVVFFCTRTDFLKSAPGGGAGGWSFEYNSPLKCQAVWQVWYSGIRIRCMCVCVRERGHTLYRGWIFASQLALFL